jgi:glutathione S-transferase
VVIILEELGVPYEIQNVAISELKTEPYININPNGKVPAITDPNTDITLWEV